MVYIVQNSFPLTVPKGHIVRQREGGDIKEIASIVNEKQHIILKTGGLGTSPYSGSNYVILSRSPNYSEIYHLSNEMFLNLNISSVPVVL